MLVPAYKVLIMILDITRHKFYEGLITLFVMTLVLIALLVVNVGDSGVAAAPDSPLMSLLASAMCGVGFLEGVAVVFMYVVSAFVLTRSALRAHIYPQDTMAPMSLCAVMTLPMILSGDALHQAVVVVLMAYGLGNMFFGFAPRKCMSRLFVAMLSSGTLAVIEPSLVVVPIVLALSLIAARKRFREIVVVVVGMLLPMFAYCYVSWLCGGSFAGSATEWWRGLVANLSLNILDNISVTRLVYIAFVIFMQAVSSVFYFAQRDINAVVVRGVWRTLQMLFVVALLSTLMMPSASDSMLTVLVMTSAASLAMFFIRSGALIAVVTYVAIVVLAFAALF